MKRINIDEKFIKFYWKAKELRDCSIKCGFGAGSLPSGYTEELCRKVYGLDKFNKENFTKVKLKGKDFDAEKDGKLIEIKFNNLITNAVNVNLEKEFDFLYHTFIDFDNDTYTVRIFEGKNVRLQFGNMGKISTPIGSFSKNVKPIKMHEYKFKEKTMERIL